MTKKIALQQPRGWEGEGLPTTKGPGAGNPVPKIEERFPSAFASAMTADLPDKRLPANHTNQK